LPRVAFTGEHLSAILNRLNNEKTVSIGIFISSEKSAARLHCFKILFFFKESGFWADEPEERTTGFLALEPGEIVTGFWAYNPEEKARRNIIEMCLIISSKYRKKGEVLNFA
jgi:hypothetical protein